MGALKKALPDEATQLDILRPRPVKMGLTSSKSLYEAAWCNEERKEELLTHYIPYMQRLTDRELKAELRWWLGKLRGVPYEQGSRPYEFIVRILKTPTYHDPALRSFSSQDRGDLQKACISVRGLVVPKFGSRTRVKRIEPEKRIAMGVCMSRHLGLNTDWRLVQYLTSYVGAKTYDGNELNWLSRYYPIARVSGEGAFGFHTSQRQFSREFVVSLGKRPFELRLDQIADFKKRVGLDRIEVWEPGVQRSLFGFEVLAPWSGDATQDHLFGMPVLPPWQGDAEQETLF